MAKDYKSYDRYLEKEMSKRGGKKKIHSATEKADHELTFSVLSRAKRNIKLR